MTCVFGGIFIFLLLAPDDPDLRPTWAVQKYIHVGLSTRANKTLGIKHFTNLVTTFGDELTNLIFDLATS